MFSAVTETSPSADEDQHDRAEAVEDLVAGRVDRGDAVPLKFFTPAQAASTAPTIISQPPPSAEPQ